MNNTPNNEILEDRDIDREFYEAFRYKFPFPLWKWLLLCGGIGGLIGGIMAILQRILHELLG